MMLSLIAYNCFLDTWDELCFTVCFLTQGIAGFEPGCCPNTNALYQTILLKQSEHLFFKCNFSLTSITYSIISSLI